MSASPPPPGPPSDPPPRRSRLMEMPDPAHQHLAGEPDERLRPPRFEHLLAHVVAAALFAVATYFTIWFLQRNAHLFGIFFALFKPYELGGGELDPIKLAWAAGSIVVFLILGWFFLETVEIYVPVSAAWALSFIFGLASCGVVFEILALAQLLKRPFVFAGPAILLAVLWVFAVRRARQPPETGEGDQGGAVGQMSRRHLARAQFERSLVRPFTLPQRLFQFAALLLIMLISGLVLYHAVLYPETYWDSLILYLGYARMMFLQGGVVTKVVGQVGYGLGANYPHLYEFLGAAVSAAAGPRIAEGWNPITQQLIAPLCGIASTVLVYHSVLRMTRHVNFSLAVTLLYRSIPLGIVYDQYASTYALAILFTAAFLYVALLYIETGLRGYFLLATLLPAFAMHLNYIMGILWLPWGLMVVAAHVFYPGEEEDLKAEERRRFALAELAPTASPFFDAGEDPVPAWTSVRRRKGFFTMIGSQTFLITLMAALLLASPWYVRNWIVTGNPVYAFFYKIFGGIHINPAVMESAELEWGQNGAGIGQMGPDVISRIRNSWFFFIVWPQQAWRLQPFFPGFVWTATALLVARWIAAPFLFMGHGHLRTRFADPLLRFGLVAALLAAALWAFHYVLAPFYLYQIIMVLPAMAMLLVFLAPYWLRPFWRQAFGFLVLLIGLVPGVAMGLMGFKVFGQVRVGPDKVETPLDLVAFRHPLPDPFMFYSWRFGPDPRMWEYINLNLKGQKILTHENRHLVFDPSIELVHLDDWDMQQLWDLEPAEQIRRLKERGIRYYLKVPNEAAHPVNARMGAEHWIVLGLVEKQREHGDNVLYRIR